MRSRIFRLTGLASVFALAAQAAATASPRPVATFAGGCFWCVETAFEGLPGVASVTSGYIGGQKANPTYGEVSSGATGHAEAVQMVYDPRVTSYEKLLDVFWHNIDPLQPNAQFCDRGSQYRSAIFFHDEAQQSAALASLRALEDQSYRFGCGRDRRLRELWGDAAGAHR